MIISYEKLDQSPTYDLDLEDAIVLVFRAFRANSTAWNVSRGCWSIEVQGPKKEEVKRVMKISFQGVVKVR
jgi:hypothetical protein